MCYLGLPKIRGALISLDNHCITHSGDYGEGLRSMIRTTKPLDPKHQIYYFEITVLEPGQAIGIGLTKSSVKSRTDEMPGWYNNSIGYHSDDGGIFHNRGSKVAEVNTYSAGDTVGCCLKQIMTGQNTRRVCFFTLNGQKLGRPISLDDGDFFPTIGLKGRAAVETNLGYKEFQFDLEGKHILYISSMFERGLS